MTQKEFFLLACAQIAAQMVKTNAVKNYEEFAQEHIACAAACSADALVHDAAEEWKEFHNGEDVFDDGPVNGEWVPNE